ncbi:alpha/beta fold hydrolase [Luedemannella helvata]|uniref:AB hydrolase-1 domain-containing protein n=1 Tax=Luedemannella helvata TaxID=349315 RepID=A0ABN2JZ46_9ACTN
MYVQEYLDRGTDRLGLHHYAAPDADTVALLWPAMGTPAGYYRPFAASLVAAGVEVVVADLRGTGSSTPRPSRASRYGMAELVDDVGAVRDWLAPSLAGRRLVMVGHSLGGQAALLHVAAAGAGSVAGIALIAVGLPYWRTYPGPGRYAVLGYTQAIAGLTSALRVWPGWTFGGVQARGVIEDWAYTARRGRYRPMGDFDAETALAGVTTPVLAVSVDNDRYTPATTVDHLCRKLVAAPVSRRHLDAAQATGRLDHFRWARSTSPLAGWVGDFARAIP